MIERPDDPLERISAYHDDALSESERAEVERELETSPELRSQYQELCALDDQLRTELHGLREGRSGLRDAIIAQLPPGRRARPWTRVASGLAAGFVIGLSLWVFQPTPELAPPTAVETRAGRVLTRLLADSGIWADGGKQMLSEGMEFTGPGRLILMDGAAEFVTDNGNLVRLSADGDLDLREDHWRLRAGNCYLELGPQVCAIRLVTSDFTAMLGEGRYECWQGNGSSGLSVLAGQAMVEPDGTNEPFALLAGKMAVPTPAGLQVNRILIPQKTLAWTVPLMTDGEIALHVNDLILRFDEPRVGELAWEITSYAFGDRALPALLDFLGRWPLERSPALRLRVAEAVQTIAADREVPASEIPPLFDRLDENDGSVREALAQAMARGTESEPPGGWEYWRAESADPEARKGLIRKWQAMVERQ